MKVSIERVKAFLKSKGVAVHSNGPLTSTELGRFAEIADLYYGTLPGQALMGLAYPESLPERLRKELLGDEPETSTQAEDEVQPQTEQQDPAEPKYGEPGMGEPVPDDEAALEDALSAEGALGEPTMPEVEYTESDEPIEDEEDSSENTGYNF